MRRPAPGSGEKVIAGPREKAVKKTKKKKGPGSFAPVKTLGAKALGNNQAQKPKVKIRMGKLTLSSQP